MDTETLRQHLGRCTREYANTGPLVRAQVRGFMEPLLFLLAGLVECQEQGKQEREQIMVALALVGCKGKNCSDGEKPTCADRGCPFADVNFGNLSTQVAAQGQALLLGWNGQFTGPAFPTIEG